MPQDPPYIAPTVGPAHEVSCTQDARTGTSTATLTVLLTGGHGFLAEGQSTETPEGLLVTVQTSVGSGGLSAPTLVPLFGVGILAKVSPSTTHHVSLPVPEPKTFPCPFPS